jgi:hypothetical protein
MATIVMLGCGDGAAPGGLTMADVAGAYQATTFERETIDGTVDQLGLGALIQVNLAASGTATGRIFIPSSAEGEADFDADLQGTWTLSGPVVRLIHAADTFLRDIAFLFTDGQLSGERTSGGATIRVTLAR